jgi:hypothetical protein
MQSLSGDWKLALDVRNVGREERWFDGIPATAQDAPVPGIVQQVFPSRFGVAWYWIVFQPLRAAGPNERYLLDFEAVDYLAEVWVNGLAVGGHEGGETPFELDATDAVKPDADNLLAVRVLMPGGESIDGMTMERVPHRCKTPDCLPGRIQNYGGIVGPVQLKVVPAMRIADVFTNPDAKSGRISVQVTLRNASAATAKGSLYALAGPAERGEIQDAREREAEIPPGDSVHELALAMPQHRLWNLDDPFLYRVQVRLAVEAVGCEHERTVRCGFRELRVEKGYFRLNGKRIFLRSTHTGNHFPIATPVPQDPDLMRRDFVMAKAAGYNTVRFICGMARPEQLDFCDEIGLMIYQESAASWTPMEDTPQMPRRFDLSVREMVLRDRNHPCVTIWGLLNETPDGPVFRQAVKALSLVRSLDPTRLVLLNSSRWDGHLEIGSLSNPGSDRWECQWGSESAEGSQAPAVMSTAAGAFVEQAGDVHIYPSVPVTDRTCELLRTLGRNSKPVFLSEYGAGSIPNAIRTLRWYEQAGARKDLAEVKLFADMAGRFEADWKKWGFDGVYSFAEDMLRDSERLHTRQRMIGFDLVRSNPRICGFNVTGMLDHGYVGEGVWTFWREWKPGTAEGFCDGWAPLRWCLFVNPLHGYSGGKFKLEAVLASEDVLPAGEYPVRLRVCGPSGIVWEKRVTLRIPPLRASVGTAAPPGEDGPLAVEVFSGNVTLKCPPGEYEFAASMDRGGAPFGGRLKFRVAEQVRSVAVRRSSRKPLTGPLQAGLPVRLWGMSRTAEDWLEKQGVRCAAFEGGRARRGEVVVVGKAPDSDKWRALAGQLAQGSCAIFTSLIGLEKTHRKTAFGWIETVGVVPTVSRDFAVANAPKEEWPAFSSEFHGPVHFRASDLKAGQYVVELGMCEGYTAQPGKRVFDVTINGKCVLANFEPLKEAGGFQRAVIRKFKVSARGGEIDINTVPKVGNPSVCRVRVCNLAGETLLEYDVAAQTLGTLHWLPLARKGRVRNTPDWLYHKECVAKAHPIFDGLQAKGIMDWDFYGQVISQKILEDIETPDDVAAAAFHTGSTLDADCPYYSGIMMASYPFGAGRFIVNTFNVLENLGTHPAADRMLLNMIHYAHQRVRPAPAPPPRNFEKTLAAIGFTE